jgi:lipopolysaccharide transport system ATP-binding protein
MSNTAIRIEHVSKMYRLGVINNGTLFRDIQTWIALKRGKEDPHSKIGENKYSGDKDHFWALKDVSFDIKQGDRVGIIGKNGAGKSTLLKLLSRITAPTEGIIKIKGKIASLLEVGTGFHGELTGRENIYLNGAILGMKKRRINEKMDSIIEFSGIEHHIDTPVKRYSSGMYVRLAFAVAAHLDSDILIADEVLAVGDAEFQKKALGKMQDLSTGEGRTVLFVSHNMVAVKKLCNNGILLEEGNIKFNGGITDTIKNYKDREIINNDNLLSMSNKDYVPELDAELEVRIIAEQGIGSFKPFAVEVILTAKRETKNISIHVVIGTDDIDVIYRFASSEVDNQKIDINTGINNYLCYLPKLSLTSGTYKLNIGFTDPFVKFYCNIEEFIFFKVPEETTEDGHIINLPVYGTTYIPHEWKSEEYFNKERIS